MSFEENLNLTALGHFFFFKCFGVCNARTCVTRATHNNTHDNTSTVGRLSKQSVSRAREGYTQKTTKTDWERSRRRHLHIDAPLRSAFAPCPHHKENVGSELQSDRAMLPKALHGGTHSNVARSRWTLAKETHSIILYIVLVALLW